MRRELLSLPLALLALLAAACGSEGEASGSVSSADGAVTIDIPEGALPDGVSRSDLSVTAEFVGAPGDSAEPWAVLEVDLSPDGTEFSVPVGVRVEIPSELLGGGLVLWHVTGDEVEALDLTFEDSSDDVVVARSTLTSFSQLMGTFAWISQTDLFDLTQGVDRDVVPVGETFNAFATLTRNGQSRRVLAKLWVPTGRDEDGDVAGEVREVAYDLTHTSIEWKLKGILKVMEPNKSNRSAIVSPWSADSPTWETFTRMDSNTHESGPTVRTCDEPGPWTVVYQAFALLRYEATPPADGIGLPVIPDSRHGVNLNAFGEVAATPGVCGSPQATTTTTTTTTVPASTTTTTTTTPPTEGADPRTHIGSVGGFVDGDGQLWVVLSPAEPWIGGPPFNLFSAFFGIDVRSGDLGANLGWQLHDGEQLQFGADANGAVPTMVVLADGSIAVSTGVNEPGLPLSITVDTGSWIAGESEPVFTNQTFELIDVGQGNPVEDGASIYDLVAGSPSG